MQISLQVKNKKGERGIRGVKVEGEVEGEGGEERK